MEPVALGRRRVERTRLAQESDVYICTQHDDELALDDDKLAKAREIINWALGCDVYFPEENIPCRTMRIKTILESDAFVSDSLVDMLSFLPVAYEN